MGKSRRLQPVAVALLLSLLLSSCFTTPRAIFRGRGHKKVNGPAPPLKVASREELSAIVVRNYDAIDSFQAQCELIASKGSIYEGKINDYTSVPGIILFSKPDHIRIRAMAPLVSTTIFDLASNGADFHLFLPKENEFFQGLNSAPATSSDTLQNLRPRAFLSSLLIRPVDPATEVAMLKDDTDELDALYRLELNVHAPDGTLAPGREIWFDRQDLSIVRQKTYDEKGDTISDTGYSKWQIYDGVPFPAHIDINRRKDGYGVAIEITKLAMNKEITADRFDLAQPEGSTLKVIQ